MDDGHPLVVSVSSAGTRSGDVFSFTHVAYAVETVVRGAHGTEWSAGSFRVHRRYRDFQWLDAALTGRFRCSCYIRADLIDEHKRMETPM